MNPPDTAWAQSVETLDVADLLSRNLFYTGQVSALKNLMEQPHVWTVLSVAERAAYRRIVRAWPGDGK